MTTKSCYPINKTLSNFSGNTGRRFVYRLVISLLFLFLVNTPTYAAESEWVYATRPGDTLWDISKKYLKSANYWSRLQEYNNVNVAKRLAPGTRLRAPLKWLKVSASPAIVFSSNGNVTYATADREKNAPLKPKQALNIGDKVITGNTGSALIQLADGSTLLVLRNSQVIFNTLSFFEQTGMVDTQLRLQKGRVETTVKPLRNKGSRFEITTPAAVAAVRGTQFRVGFEPGSKLMASEVVEGAVNVNAQNTGQDVASGFGTIAEQGKTPQTPVKLLSAPELDKLKSKIRRLPYTFNWSELKGAINYRVQIASAKSPGSVYIETLSSETQYTLTAIEDSDYNISVRGIDKNTLEGFNASHIFTVDTHFPASILEQPVNNSTLSSPPFVFSWSKVDRAINYRLQIATDVEFSQLIIDKTISENTTTLNDDIDGGKYFWRIATIDKQGDIGKYSTTSKFEIEKSSYEYLLLVLYFIPALLL